MTQKTALLITNAESSAQNTGRNCYHCGESCDDNGIIADNKSFCCTGCCTVYELLRENNLCAYYNADAHPGISFRKSRTSRFEYLDDESVRRALLQFSDGKLARTTLHLPQIHCTSCIWLLENLCKLHPAILRSEINFLKKEIAITFRQREISLRQVVELLTKLGYEPEIRLDSLTRKKDGERDVSLQKLYLKIGVAGFAFGNVMLFSFPDYLDGAGALSHQFRTIFAWLSVLLATPVLVYSASDYFVQSWYAIRQRKISLDVPVAVGIAAIYLRSILDIVAGIGTGYLDSFTGLVFFLLIGKIVQKKTFDSLSFDRDYASYFPLSVIRLENAVECSTPVANLRAGDQIFVRNQEIIPADCILQSPAAMIDYGFVTGEAEPVEIAQGATIFAGGRVIGAGAELRVDKEVSHSYLTQLWNHEAFHKEKRSSLMELSDAFGRYFTIAVSLIAGAAFLYWLPDWHKALNAFTAVLIIACPCALTLAAPFTLGAATTIFGKAKFYLKNTGIVADLARTDTIVFDKTGTLTQTDKAEIYFDGEPLSEEDKKRLAACLRHSTHPLSQQIFNFLNVSCPPEVTGFHETPGHGLECKVNHHLVTIGSARSVFGSASGAASSLTNAPGAVPRASATSSPAHTAEHQVKRLTQSTTDAPVVNFGASQVYAGIDGRYCGSFRIGNVCREGLPALLDALKDTRELFLLSGDNDHERRKLEPLFVDKQHLAFHQSPEDKLQFIARLQREGRTVAMIGDGLNDAGALKQSNVGIALTENIGAFSPACDAILDAGQLIRLPVYLGFARYALKVLAACFFLSLIYNAVGLSFAVTGKLSPLVTAILMPVSSLSVVALAWGALKIRERHFLAQTMNPPKPSR